MSLQKKLNSMAFSVFSDDYFMNEALKEAQKAFDKNEVPVGAVIVSNKKIIARAHNQVELLNDATAHAEMLAITSAMNALGAKYLDNCTIYITLEPCVMCAGALAWAKIEHLYYGAVDPVRGFSIFSKRILHPKTKIKKLVLASESEKLIKSFFVLKRK